ncbi:39K [Diatraea saccharalis granulovirus]|uniref:39K n=1 Tax=Diatraea saccharalis granulovirus TaxID=1675862 RepID=A0A0R7EZ41_9BBAC|nr:39K [Diatraea saccharalis granulovirus]AKN80791.1 39K [Diatraea saccharalis granulovirus]
MENKIETDSMSSSEEERQYMIDIKHIKNRDTLLDLFETTGFKQLLQNKLLTINLKVEVKTNDKRVMMKKKKTSTPYIINSFIFYTSFLSKADIKLKKDSKSWQLMYAVDPVTKTPIDVDGYEFRKLIEELELYHKTLVVYEDDNKTVNKESTTILRKKVIAYVQSVMMTCYKGLVLLNTDEDEEEDEINYVNARNYLSQHYKNFKSKVEGFKRFLNRHNLLKSEDEEEEKKLSKRRLTQDMVNDE